MTDTPLSARLAHGAPQQFVLPAAGRAIAAAAVVFVVIGAAAHANVERGEDHAIARAPDPVAQVGVEIGESRDCGVGGVGAGAATMTAVRSRRLLRAAADAAAYKGAAGRRPACQAAEVMPLKGDLYSLETYLLVMRNVLLIP